jgi:hypothetical protein
MKYLLTILLSYASFLIYAQDVSSLQNELEIIESSIRTHEASMPGGIMSMSTTSGLCKS